MKLVLNSEHHDSILFRDTFIPSAFSKRKGTDFSVLLFFQ